MKTNIYFLSYITHFFLEWEMFQINVVEEIKTHILCSITSFRKSWLLWDMWKKSVVGPTTDNNIIWCKHIACWITKTTNTHSQCAILNCFSTEMMVARTCHSVTLYVHCLSWSQVIEYSVGRMYSFRMLNLLMHQVNQ